MNNGHTSKRHTDTFLLNLPFKSKLILFKNVHILFLLLQIFFKIKLLFQFHIYFFLFYNILHNLHCNIFSSLINVKFVINFLTFKYYVCSFLFFNLYNLDILNTFYVKFKFLKLLL